jgi:hypothetical protein
MTHRLDDILRRIPAPALDHSLDQLEPDVWARIERSRPAASVAWVPGLRFQLAAAALALVVGLAIGWANTGMRQAKSEQSVLYATYVETGPMARLEAGL